MNELKYMGNLLREIEEQEKVYKSGKIKKPKKNASKEEMDKYAKQLLYNTIQENAKKLP